MEGAWWDRVPATNGPCQGTSSVVMRHLGPGSDCPLSSFSPHFSRAVTDDLDHQMQSPLGRVPTAPLWPMLQFQPLPAGLGYDPDSVPSVYFLRHFLFCLHTLYSLEIHRLFSRYFKKIIIGAFPCCKSNITLYRI